MEKRIRYIKDENGLRSKQVIGGQAEGQDPREYIARLSVDPSTGKATPSVTFAMNNANVIVGPEKSLHKAKIWIKMELVKLGVKFEPETRKKS